MDKVISSSITRSFNKQNNELYELLEIIPAQPIPANPVKSYTCEFQPRNDKQYIPKKKIKQKVKTVRDIRNMFEKDIMTELPAELEKQQNYILRKIKGGFIKEDKTISVAKNMLTADKPLTKPLFQMLMNINPVEHTHSLQYVLWNGKSIRINGSRGGKNKFICKYDLAKSKRSLKTSPLKRPSSNKKKGLLQNSLSVNFKPGPLGRKKFLDNSYQKYHVGHIDIVHLPKPGLEIQPSYGCALEPTISSFVNKLRDENGDISQKWAEFAVSVLGTVNESNICQTNQGMSVVTFDLCYKNGQEKLLMRRDLGNDYDSKNEQDSQINENQKDMLDVLPEIEIMMKGILDAVEINVNQDKMYKEDDENRADSHVDQLQNNHKDKLKRRYCELDRLDVRVITLNENDSDVGRVGTCNNSYCVLGCICSSLQSSVVLKGHCGRIDCMFECKCDFSKYDTGFECPELLPSLYNLNNEINCTLSKEEQKFRQTVIVNGDKSILLKSKKRNCKSSKKYEDYYSNLCLKSKSKVEPVLTIIVPKLNCENIEPWCMVHNLYKCFCKGRFTDTTSNEVVVIDITKKSSEVIYDCAANVDKNDVDTSIQEKESQKAFQYRTRRHKSIVECDPNIYLVESDEETDTCARLRTYEGRKYSDYYYSSAYAKIQDMEVNDAKIRKRLHVLVNTSCDNVENNIRYEDVNNVEKDNAKGTVGTRTCPISESDSSCISNDESKTWPADESPKDKRLPSKPTLVAWLETSYQQYKMGLTKTSLEPPKKGKVALYPWDFILNRYSERKNFFLVSKQTPYRIFMAVNMNNPLFANCINIDDIRFADLNKYPSTVKHLLTNTKNLKEYFCILYGYNHCWEFIGTVTKTGDQKNSDLEDETETNSDEQLTTNQSPKLLVDLDEEATKTISSAILNMSPPLDSTLKQSKWFIMTVENDFSEIQFYNRGFFVKYTSIIKAINVARVSGKTVRLSPNISSEAKMNDDTQFGIYAIPNSNEYCVFIGPYEVNEPLGVETIKTIWHIGRGKRTRGVWITTDKVDNLKVIDNPLSFIPPKSSEYNNVVGGENCDNDLTNSPAAPTQKVTQVNEEKCAKQATKTVKPIKISKSNGFYHLGSQSLLKTVSVLKSPNKQLGLAMKPKTFLIKSTKTGANLTKIIDTSSPLATITKLSESESHTAHPGNEPATCATDIKIKSVRNRPVAEVAPQIKIASVYSEKKSENSVTERRKEGGMFILKPEEINQRLVIDGNKSPKAGPSKCLDEEDQEISMDIEHFLDTSTICPAPENESFVISDDDDEIPPNDTMIKDIFIECTNIENLGAIKGEFHSNKGVRFVFPGFKMSDFYELTEVFTKINQVLSRRVHIPKDLMLEWHIVGSMSELKTQKLLKKECFGSNLVMTPQGIQKRKSIMKDNKYYTNIKTYLNKNKKNIDSDSGGISKLDIAESSQEFEKESQSLEEESQELLGETVSKKGDIIKSIVEASNTERNELASVLKNIEMFSNDN